jgi:2-polyprenyl-3-methyl-5-hydroxy-6-metoxy-1,4-benzoquinol methylase
MAFFTQSKFPRLWLLMQNMIGGVACKQALAVRHYQRQKRVLEIGCSAGNISSIFCQFPDIEFTGIDIDPGAIELAKRRFRKYTNFNFSVTSIEELSLQGKEFDYVLFAAMLHHVSDEDGLRLLSDAVKCTARGGQLVICEPEALKESDGWFLHFFYSKFEQGSHLRFREDLIELVERSGITLQSVEDQMITPSFLKRPYSARFNLLAGRPASTA